MRTVSVQKVLLQPGTTYMTLRYDSPIDVAVLELAKEVELTAWVLPVCLPVISIKDYDLQVSSLTQASAVVSGGRIWWQDSRYNWMGENTERNIWNGAFIITWCSPDYFFL